MITLRRIAEYLRARLRGDSHGMALHMASYIPLPVPDDNGEAWEAENRRKLR